MKRNDDRDKPMKTPYDGFVNGHQKHKAISTSCKSLMTRPTDDRGFTLLEITVAVFLLVMALLGLISTTVIVVKSNSLSPTMTTATTLAGDKMEQLKNTAYAGLAAGSETDYATMDGTVLSTSTTETIFTRTWTITGNSPVTGMKTIVVTVQWNWQGALRNVSLSSLVAR